MHILRVNIVLKLPWLFHQARYNNLHCYSEWSFSPDATLFLYHCDEVCFTKLYFIASSQKCMF